MVRRTDPFWIDRRKIILVCRHGTTTILEEIHHRFLAFVFLWGMVVQRSLRRRRGQPNDTVCPILVVNGLLAFSSLNTTKSHMTDRIPLQEYAP